MSMRNRGKFAIRWIKIWLQGLIGKFVKFLVIRFRQMDLFDSSVITHVTQQPLQENITRALGLIGMGLILVLTQYAITIINYHYTMFLNFQ